MSGEPDTLWARIISDPSCPEDVIRFINDAGELVGEIRMSADDGTTDLPRDGYEVKADAEIG